MLFTLLLIFLPLPEGRSHASRYARFYYWVEVRANDWQETERQRDYHPPPQQKKRTEESLADVRRRAKLPYTSKHLTKEELQQGLAKLPK